MPHRRHSRGVYAGRRPLSVSLFFLHTARPPYQRRSLIPISSLASKYGLAADQTLEFEVITATPGSAGARLLKASPTENRDLYWALSGGGGGTYAVVYSLTAKAHPDLPIAAANFSFTPGTSQAALLAGIAAYHAWAPSLIDQGATILAFGSAASFSIGPIIAPGLPLATLTEEITALTDKLNALGVGYALPNVQLFPGYWPAAQALMPPVPVGTSLYGGRLIPRSVVLENGQGLVDVLGDITGGGEGVSYATLGVNVNRSVAGEVDNAVLPAWREALLDVVLVV
jgi:hypothetical protein